MSLSWPPTLAASETHTVQGGLHDAINREDEKLVLRVVVGEPNPGQHSFVKYYQSEDFCFSFFLFFLGGPCHLACRIFVPQPGMVPGPLAAKVQSPHHCTTREFPIGGFLQAAVANLFGIRDQFCGRYFVDGVRWGGWFRDDLSTLHLWCPLFLSLLYQLHPRSSSVRPQRLGTPVLNDTFLRWYPSWFK